MMKNLLLKIGVVLITALIIFAGCAQAAGNYTKFGIKPERTDDSGKYIYTFESGQNSESSGKLKYIWNIEPYNSEAPMDTKNVFYCLAQGYGDFGDSDGSLFGSDAEKNTAPATTGGISQSTYTGPLNLKDKGANGSFTTLSMLRNKYANNPKITVFDEDPINGQDTIYGLVWLLDNMYIPGYDDKETFLGKIPCTDYGEMTYMSGTIQESMEELNVIGTNAEITELDIEIAQQLAIWNLTNHKLFENNIGGSIGLPIIYLSKYDDTTASWGKLKTYDTIFAEKVGDTNQAAGKIRQYYVSMVYNYLVTRANNAKIQKYAIDSDSTTVISIYENSAAQPIVTVEREKNITGEYNIIIKKVDEHNNPLRGAEFTINGNTKTTGADGTVTLDAVKITEIRDQNNPDSYTIEETGAPAGYTKYDGRIELTVTTKESEGGLRYEIDDATLDSTSFSSGKVTIDKTTNTITITVVDEEIPVGEHIDLALRKFISKVVDSDGVTVYSEEELANRVPDPDTIPLRSGATTADYNHDKHPVKVSIGDKVRYTLRIYNEGSVDAYITEVTDYLSKYLKYIEDGEWVREYSQNATDRYKSKVTSTTLTTITGVGGTVLSKNGQSVSVGQSIGEGVLLKAYDRSTDTLSYIDVQITCEVLEPQIEDGTIEDYKITNIAEITGMEDKDGTPIEEEDIDRDSTPSNVNPNLPETEQEWQDYKDEEIEQDYIPGNEDDDDFEKVIITIPKYDLALRKFIVQVGTRKLVDANGKYTREPIVDTSSLREGIAERGFGTATYKHPKKAVSVARGNTVTYIIRVYNEGNVDAYVSEITDHLPEYLEFLKNDPLNVRYGWDYDGSTRQIKTNITAKTTADPNGIFTSRQNGKLLLAYAGGDTLDYIDVAIRCKVSDQTAIGDIQTNIAEITEFTDTKGNNTNEDLDSVPDDNLTIPSDNQLPHYKEELENNPYVPGQEDDDDYDKVKVIGNFDLALRKFITKVNTTDIDSRYPELSIDNNGNIKYKHEKDPLVVGTGDIVIYTIRIYNEGEIDGYANEITDDVPFGLQFIPDNEINQEYRWVMLDANQQPTTDASKAKYLVTDYLSEEQEKATRRNNLIKAYDKQAGLSDTNPDYRDVQIAFKVTYQVTKVGEESRVLVNVAQISADSNEDMDSIPNRDEEYNDKNHEDDIDYENVRVKYFDLSLLKWVTRAIVVENGETSVIESGHTGYENPEPDLKVELKSKDVKKVVVKFAYTIKITNEGEIEGYAKEITDYIPAGLEYRQEDNPDWYIRADGKVATRQLEDVLLQPGESAEVEIILTWINGENNLGRKVNVAEISKDDNPNGVPDIDSTPDNEVPGEDDIDDAPVLLVIKTGTEIAIRYVILAVIVVAILGIGLVGIKKFVLD